MSSSKNTPLLLLGLVLASAALLALYLLGPSSPAAKTQGQASRQTPITALVAEAEQAGKGTPAKAAFSAAQGAQASGDDSQQAVLETELELLVLDGEGHELEQFSLTLDGPGGQQLMRTSAGLIRGLAPGLWKIRGETEELLPGFGKIELSLGQRRRLVIQLLDSLRVDGELFDDLGQALTRTQVWLLGPGQSHPTSPALAKARLGILTGAGGRFHLRPTKPGKYRVSVGPPGTPRWAELRGQSVEPGGPSKVHVVIPSYGRLELRMAPAPAGQAVDLLNIKVEVLSKALASGATAAGRMRGRGEGNREARQKERRESKGKTARKDAGKPNGTPHDERPADRPAPSNRPENYVRWGVMVLKDGEQKTVDSAPVERELRLVLTRRGGRFECSPSFFLRPGSTTHITLPWPAAGATEGLLGIQIDRKAGLEGAAKLGCTWTE